MGEIIYYFVWTRLEDGGNGMDRLEWILDEVHGYD